MDKSTLIIGFSFLALAIIPFLIVNFNAKKEEKKRISKFREFVRDNNGNIAILDSWNNRVLGLDRYSDCLFFYFEKNEVFKKEIIDLSKIKSCFLDQSYRKNSESQVISSLCLSFNSHSNQTIPSLQFYSEEIDTIGLNGELQIANKWLSIINNDLKLNF
jgi:hypothetical protein